MTPERRIGFLTPGWPGHNTPNGIATAVYNLATGLRDIGRTPVIVTHAIDGDCPPDIPVICLPELDWRWRERLCAKLGDSGAAHRHGARRIVAAVDAAIASHGLDALVMEETNGWAAMMQLSVPVIVTLHGPWVLHKSMASLGPAEDARRERRERRGFRAAAGIIAPSRNVLEAVEGTVSLPATPKIILPNALASPGTGPQTAATPGDGILFVGRFDLHKGGDVVLDAFARLAQAHPEARLTFVGPDRGVTQHDGSKLHMQAALARLPETVRARITYTGPLSRQEVAQVRARHTIVLIASRYENLNYTLLEAMSAGQAIVCTAVGGPAEVLEDERTALLVPPADPAAMALALGRLVGDGDLVRRLGQGAHETLKSDFDPRKIAGETLTFVDGILKNRAGERDAS